MNASSILAHARSTLRSLAALAGLLLATGGLAAGCNQPLDAQSQSVSALTEEGVLEVPADEIQAEDSVGQAAPLAAAAKVSGTSRTDILARAKLVKGFSYKWGGESWRCDGRSKGQCRGDCPRCTHDAGLGSDCSGLVAKSWQVYSPTRLDREMAVRPDTTLLRRANAYWSIVSRTSVKPADAFVSPTHAFLLDKKTSTGYYVWECRGCKYRCDRYFRRTIPSSFVVSRRKNLVTRNAFTCSARALGDADELSDATTTFSGELSGPETSL
jgi:hypothetical protein